MKTVTNLDILIGLLGRECTRVAKEIDKANSNTAVDVQDQLMTSASGKHFFPAWNEPRRGTTLTVSFFVVVTFSTANA